MVVRAREKVRYLANFENAGIKLLRAMMNWLIGATLKRESQRMLLDFSIIYGTLIKSER